MKQAHPRSSALHRGIVTALHAGFCASALFLSVSSAVLAQSSKPVAFDIPSQPLAAALKTFADQSGMQLLYRPEAIAGVTARSVKGQHDRRQALQTLLEGTNLEAVYSADNAATIRPRAKAPATKEAKTAVANPASAAEGSTQVPAGSLSVQQGGPARESAVETVELGTVIVTGTNIRLPGGSAGSKVHVIDRTDIDRTGLATAQDVLKTSPLVFQGGPSEDARGGSGANNTFFGAGVDLRGLGTSSTLTLLNGRRLPVAGGATFVDISNIPASAIDRIEILPDGASAIYGSDAIGGVVNIILRDDFDGSETQLRAGTATQGDLDEYQASQIFGRTWSRGHGVLSFEYYRRSNLANADRDYTANSDLRALGGEDFRDTFSNPGNLSGFTPEFLLVPLYGIPPGQDGTALTVDQLLPTPNLRNQNANRDVLPQQERWNVFGTVTQTFGNVELFAEGKYSRRKFSNRAGGYIGTFFVGASNPFFINSIGFGVDIVSYDFENDLGTAVFTGEVESYGGAAGFSLPLGGDWRLKGYYSYNRDLSEFVTTNTVNTNGAAFNAALNDPNPATAFNPYGDHAVNNPATIASFRQSLWTNLDSWLWSMNLVADGTVFRLPGGDVKLAIGADYREEQYRVTSISTGSVSDRTVTAAFAELYIPIISKANRRPGFENLALSLADRHDAYGGQGNIGSTSNPKIGILWNPTQGLSLRSSYGTSFKAPTLGSLDESMNGIGTFAFPDPTATTGRTLALYRVGNNSNLKNETAEVWSVGFDAKPAMIPGLQFGATYFAIDYTDRISRPPVIADILVQEDQYSSIIVRNPTAGQIAEYCNSPDYIRLGGNPAACNATPWPVLIDARLNNTSITNVRGIDFNLSYAPQAERLRRFDFTLAGTYFLKFDERFSALAPDTSTMNKVGYPIDLRLRAGLVWNNEEGLTVATFANYTPSYRDTVSQPNRKVDSLTTLDINVAYDMGGESGPLSGLVASLNVTNLFDQDPPFVNNAIGLGYDPQNADPIGRFISANITKRW